MTARHFLERHFLEIDDLAPGELTSVLDLAELTSPPQVMAGRGMALVFEKPSLRTRQSTEMAVVQLGGHPITLRGEEIGLETREPVADVARVLSRYHAVIGARVFDHGRIERMATAATVPVVNLLSDRSHPCQTLADLLTLRQRLGGLAGVTLTYVGDYNNVARSLAVAAPIVGLKLRIASPHGYGPDEVEVERLGLDVTTRPADAVDGADAVYTDVWTSMGQEDSVAERRRSFEGFTVDARLMTAAAPDAVFLHCLPAHRGEEVAAEVVDGPRSLVWQQAENRMHAMRGLLVHLLTPRPSPGGDG